MAGIQFGGIVSFSLTLHTWELKVTSEVGRKMILLGHPIRYVIYYQLQGHLMIIFNVLFGFSISEKEVAFFWYDMNTSVCKHVRKIVRNFGYRFLILKILIRPLPERIQKVRIVFSHVVRRDTLCLIWYYYL
jgi:hypothetical protein